MDLALRISEKLGVKKQLASAWVNTLFKAMRESLIQGNRIEIRGFGDSGSLVSRIPSRNRPQEIRKPVKSSTYRPEGRATLGLVS